MLRHGWIDIYARMDPMEILILLWSKPGMLLRIPMKKEENKASYERVFKKKIIIRI